LQDSTPCRTAPPAGLLEISTWRAHANTRQTQKSKNKFTKPLARLRKVAHNPYIDSTNATGLHTMTRSEFAANQALATRANAAAIGRHALTPSRAVRRVPAVRRGLLARLLGL